MAVASLVLGILGILCCWICAPIAWVLGQTELKHIREGKAPVKNAGLARAGQILGIIGTVMFVFGLMWLFLFGGLSMLRAIIEASHG